MNGVINVYKEPGYTSHDVVAKLRGILKMKKIGHTGTLDPQAEGVLPVCLGQATKLCDLLTDKTKEYEAVLRLGITTDTQDITGKVLTADRVTCDEIDIKNIMSTYIGKQQQIPPMYSALKVNGKKLYELAREGKEVERKPREIEIFSLEILEIAMPLVRFSVHCSKGTYVRTLCHDIGQALGCGGCMEHLLRTRVERFLVSDALKLSEIETLRDENRLKSVIVPVEDMFEGLPKAVVARQFQKLIDNGNAVTPQMILRTEAAGSISGCEPSECETSGNKVRCADAGHVSSAKGNEAGMVRVYNEDMRFYGIYAWDEGQNRYKPYKMFI